MNNQIKYFFFTLNEFVNFSGYIWIFRVFLYILKSSVFEQIESYNRETITWNPEKNRVCDMASCYKNISKIRNVTFIF